MHDQGYIHKCVCTGNLPSCGCYWYKATGSTGNNISSLKEAIILHREYSIIKGLHLGQYNTSDNNEMMTNKMQMCMAIMSCNSDL